MSSSYQMLRVPDQFGAGPELISGDYAANKRTLIFERVASANRNRVFVLGSVWPLSRRAIADWLVPMRLAN